MKNYQQYIPSHYQQSFFDNYRVKLTLGQTLFQLILGGMMLGHGFREDCNNGATDYLFTGGAIIVATHILPFIKAICHLPSIICVTNPNESHSLTPSLPLTIPSESYSTLHPVLPIPGQLWGHHLGRKSTPSRFLAVLTD